MWWSEPEKHSRCRRPSSAWNLAPHLAARQGTVQQQMLPEVKRKTGPRGRSTKSRAPPAAGVWQRGRGPRICICICMGFTDYVAGPGCEGGCGSQPIQIKRHFRKPLPPCLLFEEQWVGREFTVLWDGKFLPSSPHCSGYAGGSASPMYLKWPNVRKWLGHQELRREIHTADSELPDGVLGWTPQAFSKWPRAIMTGNMPHSHFWNSLPEPSKRSEAELSTQDWGRWECLLGKSLAIRWLAKSSEWLAKELGYSMVIFWELQVEAGSYQIKKKGTEPNHKQPRRQMACEGEIAGQPLCEHLDLLRDDKRQKATCLLLHPAGRALAPDFKAVTGQNNWIVKMDTVTNAIWIIHLL